MAYRGKFPDRIKSVQAGSGKDIFVELNNGSVWCVNGGKVLLRVGQDLGDALADSPAEATLVRAGAGDVEAIYCAALAAANAAAKAKNDSMPPEQERGLDCGFASVVVRPARGPFVTWCRKNDKGNRHWSGGWAFSMTSLVIVNTQSVDVFVAAARAFSDELAKVGIRSDVESRLD